MYKWICRLKSDSTGLGSTIERIVLLPDYAFEIACLMTIGTILPRSIVYANQSAVDEDRARLLDVEVHCEFDCSATIVSYQSDSSQSG
jgi:hypothetical protein